MFKKRRGLEEVALNQERLGLVGDEESMKTNTFMDEKRGEAEMGEETRLKARESSVHASEQVQNLLRALCSGWWIEREFRIIKRVASMYCIVVLRS